MPYKDPEVRKAYLREYHRRWYAEHAEERREQIRHYKAMNQAKVAAGNEAYRARPGVREAATQRKREWRAANRERDNRGRRLWQKANRERVAEYNSKRDRREYNRAYYEANRERLLIMSSLNYAARRDAVTDVQFDSVAAKTKRSRP